MVENEGNVSSEQTVNEAQSQTENVGEQAAAAPEVTKVSEPKTIREKIQATKVAKDAEATQAKSDASPKAHPDGKGGTTSTPTQHQAGNPNTGASNASIPAIAAEGAPAAVYTPSLKFKFKGEEKPIPEFFHSLIKDEASEKQVREVLEKANWLDEEKPKLTKKVEEFDTMNRGLQVLDSYLHRDQTSGKVKDFGRFAKSFGLTEDDVLHHAQDILQYRTAQPEQQKQMDQERQQNEEMERLRVHNEQLQQNNLQFESQNRTNRMQALNAHPLVAPVVEKYLGGAQAFNRDVAREAYLIEVQSQGRTILTTEQAVEHFLVSRGLMQQPGNGAQAQVPQVQQAAVPAQQVPQAPVQQQQAPTLPKVTSQNSSPAKKVPQNLNDLKKIRDQAKAAYSGE